MKVLYQSIKIQNFGDKVLNINMSLLTQQANTPPSDEQQLQFIANQIKRVSSTTYSNLVELQKDGIKMLWKNIKYTPQQIIDALGEDAIKVFQFHGGLTEYIMTISAVDGVNYIPALPTNAFTIDPNTGKITVTNDPYTP